eukprot:GEMP01015943.1.p1 GENE.GEMP01015943.1~~GEMP01015943.1.p1  ORF type:complete len:860 (+),score=149.52 GEMP01015943.1:197-2776(+)
MWSGSDSTQSPVTREWVNHAAVKERLSVITVWPNSRYGLNFNPRTTAMTTVCVWCFVIACLIWPSHSKDSLYAAKSWITDVSTWFYVVTKNIWILFIAVLYFSKYGDMKLGKPEDKPDYTTLTWFMMLFACGAGNEMFYYGVAEPIYHYSLSKKEDEANRYSHLTRDERAEWAMGLTFFHEGFHGWVIYAIVGLSVAFAGHRMGLPVTIRSCLYALLGDKVFGPLGDMVDSLSASCTMIGICTTLGLGVIDVNSGIARLSGCPAYSSQDACNGNAYCKWQDLGRCRQICEYFADKDLCTADPTCKWVKADVVGSVKCFTKTDSGAYVGFGLTRDNQILTLWVVTLVATISVVTGLKFGIRVLSEVCFIIGNFLWVYVFLADNPWYFLDVFTMQIGLYIQWIAQMGFHTDAYARHTAAPDSTVNNMMGDISEAFNTSASDKWMDSWTMFFWGWWVAWSPFVGMFIAKISKGRTIREFLNGTMIAPMIYTFAWYNVFGGSGIKMERLAEMAQLRGTQSPAYLLMNPKTGLVNTTQTCVGPRVDNCIFVSRLSERPQPQMWMDMLEQFGELAPLVTPISLIAILLYFVTSSDSGSLVIDSLCSNGIDDTPVLQKIYWALTEGACASALIYAGYGTKDASAKVGFEAMEFAALCSGFPYTIVLCLLCSSLWKGCQYEYGLLQWTKERFFRTDLTEILDFSTSREWQRTLGRTLLAIVAPTYFLRPSLSHSEMSTMQQKVYLIVITIFFYLWPLFICLGLFKVVLGIALIGWWWFACFVSMLCSLRNELRTSKNIEGNVLEDMFACLFAYFLVVDQLDNHFGGQSQNSEEEDGDKHLAIEKAYSNYGDSPFDEGNLVVSDGAPV